MWIAAATYCVVLAPKTLLATLIGVLGMAHFSLGNINYALVQCFPNIFGHGTFFNLVNIYRTYVRWSLIYQIKVSALRYISKQMKGSYKNSYMNSILNYDHAGCKLNKKSMIFWFLNFFTDTLFTFHGTPVFCRK